MVSYSSISGASGNSSDGSRGRRYAKTNKKGVKMRTKLTIDRRRSSRALKEQNYAGQASFLSSCINLVNTSTSPAHFPWLERTPLANKHAVIGSGLLASPLAMAHMGIALGTFVILWSGLASAFGLYLQTRCARYLDRGTASFFALSQITYPNAAVIFDAAIAIKCFGVGVSYLIIIGDLMPGVVRGFMDGADSVPFMVDRHFWVTAFM